MWKSRKLMKAIAAVSFLVMLSVHGFADIVRLNGNTVNEIIRSYPNLYLPAVYVFYIWILIYLMQAGFAIYQLDIFRKDNYKIESDALGRIRLLFTASSLLGAVWTIAFHYNYQALSLVLMIMAAICSLVAIGIASAQELSLADKLLIRLPFGIFGAWSLILALLTLNVLVISIGWQDYGIFSIVTAAASILAGTAAGITILLEYKDISFGLTLVWAYIGILIKHMSVGGFNRQYPEIIASAAVSTAALAALSVYLIISHIRKVLKP